MSIFDEIEEEQKKKDETKKEKAKPNQIKVFATQSEYETVADFFNMIGESRPAKTIEPENEKITWQDVQKTGIVVNFKKVMVQLGIDKLTKASVYSDFVYSCILVVALIIRKKQKTVSELFKPKRKPIGKITLSEELKEEVKENE